jgi:hypothetical protein
VASGGSQVFDDAWMKRLGIGRRDFGIGMTSPEVTELTRQIDVGALREYRDAVGRRTREIIGRLPCRMPSRDLRTAAPPRNASRSGVIAASMFSGRSR